MVRVLVVGLGQVAVRHIRNLRALDPGGSVAVWRQRPDPPDWRPPEGVAVDAWLYSREDVWDWGPEAAVVANPASMHVDTALDLVPMGAHLFIEKPLSHDLLCTPTLIEECQRRRLVLYVGYDLRHYAPLQSAKTALDAGRIGRPMSIRCEVGQYLPDWRPGRDYRTSVSAQRALGGGVLLELSHELDYARWLMGEVASVSAMAGRLSDLDTDVEDTADILLRFRSGALGNIHLDMVDRAPVRRCRVVGTEGSIECNLLTRDAWICKCDGRRQIHYHAAAHEDPFLAEMRHFLACCRGEAEPPVSGEEGRRVLQIALACRASSETGTQVDV